MKKVPFTYLLILTISLSSTFAQRGKQGAFTVSTTNTIVNEYTYLVNNATGGATAINVFNNTLNANNRFGAGNILAPGDLIFIIQMQGATITSCCDPWWYSYGYINNYNGAGSYEFAQVLSVQGNNTINLTCGLSNTYTASGKVQIVRVPRYTTLQINSNAELSCDPWDGNFGGLLIVETLGNINIAANGSLNANGKGFRGGVVSGNSGTTFGSAYFFSTNNVEGGQKGEGIGGYGVVADGTYGRGAPANGGGGGNAHNGGGGGGSNTCPYFQWNGCGFPDTTTSPTYIQAWDLENGITNTVPSGLPFHKNASYGGGRGGYSFSSTDADALTTPPGHSSWAGDFRRVCGGLGGWPLASVVNGTPRLFFGGGGGGGNQNDGWGGAGGRGGGIVYVMSYGSVSGSGTITSNGSMGNNSEGTPTFSNPHAGTDGSGGGGGGGAIIINAIGNINGISAQANGGNGGNQIKSKYFLTGANMEAEGPGGGGGGGYIAISNGSITRNTNGGLNGTSSATGAENIGVTEFPPNGATKGSIGINNANVTSYYYLATSDTVCQGQTATLQANIYGNLPAGTTYGWFATEFSTTPLSTSLTFIVNNPQITSTYYFGTCPGTYRIPVTLTVSAFIPDAGANTILCVGDTIILNASGGTTYSWQPSTGLSDTSIANPFCFVTTNTLYTVQITNANGCQGQDSMWVTTTSITPQISNDTAICAGETITLTANGGNSYVWSNAASTTSIVVSPTTTTNYSVTVTQQSCSATENVLVTVNPLPIVNIGHDTTICQGDQVVLNAQNNGYTYLWSPGNQTTQSITVSASGSYGVEVASPFGCNAADSMLLSVLNNADATIIPHSPVCENINAFNLIALQSGGIWSGQGIQNTSNGLFSPSQAGAGNHLITYNISGLCGDSDTILLGVYEVPTISDDYIAPSCNNDLKGSVFLSATNGLSPYSYLWNSGDTTSILTGLTAGSYMVTVTDNNLCQTVSTFTIEVPADLDCNPVIYIPNIFSPNNDNVNDILFVRGNEDREMVFAVFDRWGNKVFETDSYSTGWDGKYKGQDMSEGVYAYYYKSSKITGEAILVRGNVTLVR